MLSKMIYKVKIGEMLVIGCASNVFATWKDNDIRTVEFLDSGRLVLALDKKIIKKFVKVTTGSSTGWLHIGALDHLEHAAVG